MKIEKYEKDPDWGQGPWMEEPDRIEWTDEETGYPCLLTRNHDMGNLCGYVAVPKGHPYYHKTYNEIGHKISAHGGLTYSRACQGHICHEPEPGEPDNVWWFGFDCAHASQDLIPGMRRMQETMKNKYFNPTYKDLNYVIEEIVDLARQLKEAERG